MVQSRLRGLLLSKAVSDGILPRVAVFAKRDVRVLPVHHCSGSVPNRDISSQSIVGMSFAKGM